MAQRISKKASEAERQNFKVQDIPSLEVAAHVARILVESGIWVACAPCRDLTCMVFVTSRDREAVLRILNNPPAYFGVTADVFKTFTFDEDSY